MAKSSRQAKKSYKVSAQAQRQREQLAVLGVVVGVVVLFGIVLVIALIPATGVSTGSSIASGDIPRNTLANGLPIFGEPEAKITLIEFSNFSCPGCAQYASEIKGMIEQHVLTGQARFVFVPIVFGFGDDPSFLAAQAAVCADKQGALLEMHDALFTIHRTRGARSFEINLLRDTASDLGLDGEALVTCIASGEAAPVVQRGLDWLRENNVRYTPTLLYSLDGARTLEWFKQPNGVPYDASVPGSVVAEVVAQHQ